MVGLNLWVRLVGGFVVDVTRRRSTRETILRPTNVAISERRGDVLRRKSIREILSAPFAMGRLQSCDKVLSPPLSLSSSQNTTCASHVLTLGIALCASYRNALRRAQMLAGWFCSPRRTLYSSLYNRMIFYNICT